MNAVAGARRPARRALAEIHYRLRTECDTPRRKALAVFIGVAIGCLPVYGLHLPLCLLLARLVRVNRITAYLASHINNPFTAPLILYLEFGLGYSLFHGHWPVLELEALRAVGLWHFARDLAVGSLVLGGVLGATMAAVALRIGRRRQHEPLERDLIEASARPYLATGILNWEYVRGKLRHDPLYVGLVKAGVLPRRGRLLDLGCGQGILLSLLRTASRLDQGAWPPDWPPPPQALQLTGVDVNGRAIARARQALGEHGALLQHADLRAWPLPSCDVALLLDVLFYLRPAEQRDLIARVTAALPAGGVLLLREPDADAGWRFRVARAVERLCALSRGRWRQRCHYRGAREWVELLRYHGFQVTIHAGASAALYANVLFVAHRS